MDTTLKPSAATKPQTFRGTVVKTAMTDTATVAVSRYVKHPKYKKYQVRTKKYQVHDPANTAKIGDQVTIIGVAPISKLKRFALKSIDVKFVAPEEA